MNIVKKIVNNIKYYKYRKKRDWDQPVPEDMWIKVAEYCDNDVIATEEALAKMQGHVKDKDPTLWKYWCMVYLHYLRECMIIPFK